MGRRTLYRPGLTTIALFVVIALGAVDAWAGRRSYFGADNTAYMNIVARVSAGDPGQVINGLWSPLYPLLLTAFVWQLQHDAVSEFAVVRGVNFLIFVATAVVFSRFLKLFVARIYASPEDRNALGRGALEVAGWSAFAWACLSLNLVCRVSPDTLVITAVFAAAAIILSLRDGPSRAKFILLGIVLGLGYWAKAILFPLGFVILAAALFEPAVRTCKGRLLLALGTLVLLAAPLVALQSVKRGRLTFSESGRLNYAWHVNRVPHWIHWQGGPPGHGQPVHRSRQIFENPDAFAWDAPVPVSYHPWYDPTYWYSGVQVPFSLDRQRHVLVDRTKELAKILLGYWPFLAPVGIALALALVSRPLARLRASVQAFLPLWIISAAGVAIFLPVHVESRYVAGFLGLGWLLVFSLASFPPPPLVGRWRWLTGVVLPALCVIGSVSTFGPRLLSAAELIVATRGDVRDERWLVAEAFAALGVPRGTPVASIGEAYLADWHRLARVRVVAEVPSTNNERKTGDIERFWAGGHARQEALLDAFKEAGAQFVVADQVPRWADTTGWNRIGQSGYYYRPLEK
jgi:hypothetical protein